MINKRLWRAALIVLACFAGQANAKIWYYDDAMSEEFYESVEKFCTAYVALQDDGYQYELVRVVGADTEYGYCFVKQTRSDGERYFKDIVPGRILCSPNTSPKANRPWPPRCPCDAGYEPDPSAGFYANLLTYSFHKARGGPAPAMRGQPANAR